MQKMIWVLLLGLLIAGAWGETFEYHDNGVTREVHLKAGDSLNIHGSDNVFTILAQGGAIDLHGSDNQVKVTGRVEALDIHGQGNRVTVDAELASLELHGVNNQVVLIRAPGRQAPAIDKHGENNTVTTRDR